MSDWPKLPDAPHRVIFLYPPESTEHRTAFRAILWANLVVAILGAFGVWALTGERRAFVAVAVFLPFFAVVLRFFLWSWWGR